ncbi:Cyclin-B2-4 [Capsicum baccatum]|uniref:Cyclin-B2-4 n=1 Tax=Capsicum baccatum TaxID=33114 RepID=A0A2G2VTS5_CAPBA|nr:Cyclin-B2-4 [Capsicum baccatum]
MSSKINRVEYFIDPNDWFRFDSDASQSIFYQKHPFISDIEAFDNLSSLNTDFWAFIECGLNISKWKLPTQIANKQQKSTVEITKPPIPVAPIRNKIEDCIIINPEDCKATGYSDVPMFVQHTEAMMEEIDRMDEETEMKDAEDWSIMNIDSSNKKNKLTVVEYIDDIYAYYKKAEVHYKFKLMVETLYLTMNLIDRFLAVQSLIRKKLQLVGITTLLLACKYEEVFVPVVKELILISDKAYARKEVLEMFNMTVPTTYAFMQQFFKASQSDKKAEIVSFFLIELCLVEYEMLRFSSSMLAAATVFTAQCILGVSREWNTTCEKHSSYDKNQILYENIFKNCLI